MSFELNMGVIFQRGPIPPPDELVGGGNPPDRTVFTGIPRHFAPDQDAEIQRAGWPKIMLRESATSVELSHDGGGRICVQPPGPGVLWISVRLKPTSNLEQGELFGRRSVGRGQDQEPDLAVGLVVLGGDDFPRVGEKRFTVTEIP